MDWPIFSVGMYMFSGGIFIMATSKWHVPPVAGAIIWLAGIGIGACTMAAFYGFRSR